MTTNCASNSTCTINYETHKKSPNNVLLKASFICFFDIKKKLLMKYESRESLIMDFEKTYLLMGLIFIILGVSIILLPNLLRLKLKEIHPFLLWRIWDSDGFVIYTSPLLIIISVLLLIYSCVRGS